MHYLLSFLVIGICAAAFGGIIVVHSLLSSRKTIDGLWWRYDPRTPSALAILSCMWNIVLLRHRGELICKKAASATPVEASEFLLVLNEDCDYAAAKLRKALFQRALRHSAIDEFIAILKNVTAFESAQIRRDTA